MTAAVQRRVLQLLRLNARILPCSQDGTTTCRQDGLSPEKWCVSCETNAFLEDLDSNPERVVRHVRRRR
jgi:hypothetical protein